MAPPLTSTSSTINDTTNRKPKSKKKGKARYSPTATSDSILHQEDDYDMSSTSSSSSSSNTLAASESTAAYRYAFCAALNSCNLGYDLGVSTNVGPLLQNDFSLSDSQLELFLGSLNFWSIFGALVSPIVTDQYGRRTTFAAAATAFIAGCFIMATSPNFEVLMVGRMIVGLGVGVGEAIDPMYIAEIAPSHLRGELVSWAEAGVAVGVVLGFSSSLLLYALQLDQEPYAWRIMLALGMVLPCIMLLLVKFVMPESPRWLLAKDQPEQANTVLQKIYPHHDNVQEIATTIQQSLQLEQEAAQAVGWTAILWRPSPAIRRMLVVGVGMAIIQQAVGIDSVMFYLLYVIKGSGITSELGQIISLIVLGTVKLVFVFVGAKLFDKAGRRPLLFISLLGCAGSLLVVAVLFEDGEDNELSKTLVIVGLALYLAFFSTGLGPGNWVVVSEVFATSIRAKAMSVAVLPNRIAATVMASTFLTMANKLTWPGFFLLLAGVCVASAAFLYIYLPETKGKSLEEMAVYFAQITGDRSILDVEEKLGKKTQSSSIPTSDDAEEEPNVEMMIMA